MLLVSQLQGEVYEHGPALVTFFASESFTTLSPNEVYTHDTMSPSIVKAAVTVLGWVDDESSGSNDRVWVVMNTNADWGDKNIGMIRWTTLQQGDVSEVR